MVVVMNLITLNKEYEILLKDTITEYLSPNYIYIPVNNKELLVNPKDYIYKGKEVLTNTFSPISGKILGIKECYDLNIKKKFLVLENDFKEKYENRISIRKNLEKLSENELLEALKTFNLDLYNKFNTNYKKIIVNTIDEQLYVANNMFIINEYSKDLLETLNALGEILNISQLEIVVKDTDYNIINSLNSIIGLYPNISIKFLPDKYLISQKEILCDYLNIDSNFIYIDIQDLYNLYNFLKRRKKIENKFITITGTAIDNPQVIKCKLNTKLDYLIKDLVAINDNDYVLLLNSLLSEPLKNVNDIIITQNINSIFIMKKRSFQEKKCILCGRCNDVCPVKIKVSNLINNKKCNHENCIKCGLCNYICPSYININKYLDGDNNE